MRLTAEVHGRVQGVGFRYWVQGRAREVGVTGWARNLPDGRVQVVAEGSRAACEALLAAVRGAGAPGRVDGVVGRFDRAQGGLVGFQPQ